MNEYVLNSLDFLNKYSFTSGKKLTELDFLLYNLDAKLQLLEKKLDSVPPEYY
jgi:WASH complex subunit CCDC53